MFPNNDLPESLNGIIRKLSNVDFCKTLGAAKGKKFLQEAHVKEEELLSFANFDYPTRDCYGRKMIYDGGHFELLVMSWNPGAYSSIHTHGGAEWGTVQVFGKAHHIVYSFEKEVLKIEKKEITEPGRVLEVDADLIHQMGNATSERFISLHLYCSTAVTCDVTAYAQNFDLEFNRIAYTTGGAFFNLPKENIHTIKKGVSATDETFLHYATTLLHYYARQENTPRMISLKENLLKQINEVVCKTKKEPVLIPAF